MRDSKKIHAEKIKAKYFLDNVHIYIPQGYSFHYVKGEHIVYISKKNINELNSTLSVNEIRAPATLDKIMRLLKKEKAFIKDIDNNETYTLQEYVYYRMILRLSCVE